jgi:hypothetical protein
MHNLKELFLIKSQGTPNCAYTDIAAFASGENATDLAQILKGSSFEPEIPCEAIEIVAGGFDQYAAVPGKETGKGTLQFAMNPASASGKTEPQWGKALRILSDYSLASTTAGTAPSNYVYTPMNDATDGGFLTHYTGSQSANGALVSRFYNVKGTFKISGTSSKVPTISFESEGAFYSEVDGTQPDISSAKARESAISLKGAIELVLGSAAYKLLSFEIDGGQTEVNREDISEVNGAGRTDTTNRKIKLSCKCYAETKSVIDPLAALKASTEGIFKIIWGSGTKAITFLGTYLQITERKKSDENGITAFDIKAQFNRNDFTIKVN